jgi:hypothetical protein
MATYKNSRLGDARNTKIPNLKRLRIAFGNKSKRMDFVSMENEMGGRSL